MISPPRAPFNRDSISRFPLCQCRPSVISSAYDVTCPSLHNTLKRRQNIFDIYLFLFVRLRDKPLGSLDPTLLLTFTSRPTVKLLGGTKDYVPLAVRDLVIHFQEVVSRCVLVRRKKAEWRDKETGRYEGKELCGIVLSVCEEAATRSVLTL